MRSTTPLTNAALAERSAGVFLPNYKPSPLVIERGEGCSVFDVEGRRYLDLVGGIAVSVLGHGHPRLVQAIRDQAGRILHTSNLYLNRPAIELGERLLERCFGERVFFCNSGAEANEAQIKLARRYAYDRGDKERIKIITFDQSFHGRTYGALAATAQPKYQEGFGPMPGGFEYSTYGDVAALERAVDEKTAAVLVEPIQGEGGVRVAPPGFLAACRRITRERGALLLLDEVQVGVGRTGRMFCHQWEEIVPDSMSIAKGIGGGLPLGAIVTTAALGSHLTYGTHATTFGGNPVACAAGLAVLEALSENGFLEHVVEVGRALEAGLNQIGTRSGAFSEVRGRGLLIGAVLHPGAGFEAKDIVDACRARGVLVHVAGRDVLRLAPPLILSAAEAQEGLEAISAAVDALGQRRP